MTSSEVVPLRRRRPRPKRTAAPNNTRARRHGDNSSTAVTPTLRKTELKKTILDVG